MCRTITACYKAAPFFSQNMFYSFGTLKECICASSWFTLPCLHKRKWKEKNPARAFLICVHNATWIIPWKKKRKSIKRLLNNRPVSATVYYRDWNVQKRLNRNGAVYRDKFFGWIKLSRKGKTTQYAGQNTRDRRRRRKKTELEFSFLLEKKIIKDGFDPV